MSAQNRPCVTPSPFKSYHGSALSIFGMKESLDLAWGHSLYVAELHWRPDWGSPFPCSTQPTASGHCWSASLAGLGHGSGLEVEGKHIDESGDS